MINLFDWLKYGAGALAGALIASPFVYYAGKQAAGVETLQATVDAYRTREAINNETSSISDRTLCLALGGLPDQCEQLRGVAEDDATTRNRPVTDFE